ncbi:hypothetical protein Agub_g4802 [Astrephomene gubernaculifera]|uniref:Golgin-84 n=1 Tax=Astrephomene gubernaculifera TaxID=47775 RepID=A0AAD3DLB2_9CHLO|nr:hypothetical protein Agub_g4802 [Astrephomene gubernaculifera]
MASWLTAQLKVAEGLLEAVDKTVSRTVGTLGLAEGEPESSAGGPNPASGLQQDSPHTLYSQPYIPTSAAPQGYSLAVPTSYNARNGTTAGGLENPASYYASTASAPGWEARSEASGRTPGGASAGSSSTPSGPAGGGFTVKSDAPIPFGSRAPLTAPAATGVAPAAPPYSAGGSLRSSSSSSDPQTGLAAPSGIPPAAAVAVPPTLASPTGTSTAAPRKHTAALDAGAASISSPLAASFPAAAAAPAAAASTSGAEGAGVSSNGSSTPPPKALAAGQRSGGGSSTSAPAAASSSALGTASSSSGGSQPAVDPPSVLPSPPSTASTLPPGAAGEGLAQEASFSAPGPEAAPSGAEGAGPLPSSLTAGEPGGQQQGSGGSATSAGSSSSTSAASGAAPAAPPPPAAGNTTGTLPGAATQLPTAAAAPAPTAPAPAPPAAPAAAAGGSTPAAAAAASAAAASLASATTSAVAHSLSFLNLVLDDSDAAAAADAPPQPTTSSALHQQQIQSLTRTCEQLRKRLEASRVENEQLEDMLARAEVRAQQEAALVSALREELAASQQGRAAAESSLAAQLAVARAGLAEVSGKYEASQRAVLVLEGQLAALEESSRRLLEQHSDREGDMVEALRSELAAAESRLAAERRAHQASRAAAASREQDLEQQVAGSTAALGELTRGLEEANRKSRALEEEVVAATRGRNELAARVAALQRQLAEAGIEMEGLAEGDAAAASPGGGGGGPVRGSAAAAAAAAAAAELDVLRGEVLQHRRAAAAARQAAEASEAQVAAMAAELEGLRQSLEQRKDTAQLESQLAEVSDMLYLKQTQLERLAAEKAAQQLKTERELDSTRQELAKLTRQLAQQGAIGSGLRGLGGGPHSSSSSSAPHDVIPMDALGEPYQRLARHTRVGKAVKAAANFLDGTASTTAFVLRQYPLARLVVFGYVVLIHLYVYLLIARMQRLATHYEAAVVTAPGGAA